MLEAIQVWYEGNSVISPYQQAYHRDPREAGGFAEIMDTTLGNILCNNLELIAEEIFCSCIEPNDAKALNKEFSEIPVKLFEKLNWIELFDVGLEPSRVIKVFLNLYY